MSHNFLTDVCTDGTTFIVNGWKTKSINQWYNKLKAKRQARLPGGVHRSRYLTRITRKRENRIRDFMRKAAYEVIHQAKEHNCGTIIIGANKGPKQTICLGAATKQNCTFSGSRIRRGLYRPKRASS